MKDNTLKIALIVGGGLLAYYFYNINKQQKVATQPVFLDGEDQGEEERQEMPMGGGGGGGGFSPTPTVTPAVVIATTSPVVNTLPTPSTAPSTPASLINLAPAPSTTQPVPSSQLASSPSPMVSPIVKPTVSLVPKPMASPKPFVSQALMGTNLQMPKSPFSGMDGRNSYDIDAKLDL
jgi:hypothetical protein